VRCAYPDILYIIWQNAFYDESYRLSVYNWLLFNVMLVAVSWKDLICPITQCHEHVCIMCVELAFQVNFHLLLPTDSSISIRYTHVVSAP